MGYGIQLRSDQVRTTAFGAIGVTYSQVGGNFEHPTRALIVQNLTDAVLMFSFDNDVDHFPLPAGGLLVLDISSNLVNESAFFISMETVFSVRHLGIAPTSGAVYVTALYARGD